MSKVDRLQRENETLYAVINTVSSSLDLPTVLDGVVELATEATDCHACFIYFVEGERLVMRAASPVYRPWVGRLAMGLDEGLTGWVARSGTPEFIRDQALEDPRMKYMPELEEEHFQSMVAVPVLSKDGPTIGVIVLHTAAPREFDEDVLNFLVHTASLVAGAIENATVFAASQRRVAALTGLTQLSERLAGVTEAPDLYDAVTAGGRDLLGVDACHVYRLDTDRDELVLAGGDPVPGAPPAKRVRGTQLLFDLLQRDRGAEQSAGRIARALWPAGGDGVVLVAPLLAGDQALGILCALSRAPRTFSEEEAALFRSVADQAAVGVEKAELIERLTASNAVKDLFAALADGSTEVAEARARATGFDLGQPHVHLHAEPVDAGAPDWPGRAETLEADIRAQFPNALLAVGHEALRGVLPVRDGNSDAEAVRAACDERAVSAGASVGLGSVASAAAHGRRGLREAADAARIGRVLRPGGGAAAYDELGAYRYLVHLPLDAAPRDRHWQAVEALASYDAQRKSHLVDTLEQFLRDRRSVAASARALFIHPNTLRQRLGRIEKLSGLDIDAEDLLSLELAIKLVRLRGAGQG